MSSKIKSRGFGHVSCVVGREEQSRELKFDATIEGSAWHRRTEKGKEKEKGEGTASSKQQISSQMTEHRGPRKLLIPCQDWGPIPHSRSGRVSRPVERPDLWGRIEPRPVVTQTETLVWILEWLCRQGVMLNWGRAVNVLRKTKPPSGHWIFFWSVILFSGFQHFGYYWSSKNVHTLNR